MDGHVHSYRYTYFIWSICCKIYVKGVIYVDISAETDGKLYETFKKKLPEMYELTNRLKDYCERKGDKEVQTMCTSCMLELDNYWSSHEFIPIAEIWTKLTNIILPAYNLYHLRDRFYEDKKSHKFITDDIHNSME